MTRENIVENKFILYGDQIAMIKDALASHKYTITNIIEHSAKKRDLEHRNVWESFVQDINELTLLFSKLDNMVSEHKVDAVSCRLLVARQKDEISSSSSSNK
jgi:hypothetical protein